MMFGMVSAAGAIGMLVIPLVTQVVLARAPWQTGILFFVLLAIVMLPAAYWAGGADTIPGTGPAPKSMGEVLGQAIRNRPFLVMSGAYFVCGLNLMFLGTHLPAYLAFCGQDPMLGAGALAVIGGTSAIGSLVTGWLGGRYPKHVLLGLLYILRSIMFVAYFMLPPTQASTLLFAAAMGLLWWPGLIPLIAGLIADIFGTRYMTTLLGMSFVVHQIGSSIGTWGGGLIFDLSGSYDAAWQIGALMGLSAGVVQIVAGGPTRRQIQNHDQRSHRVDLKDLFQLGRRGHRKDGSPWRQRYCIDAYQQTSVAMLISGPQNDPGLFLVGRKLGHQAAAFQLLRSRASARWSARGVSRRPLRGLAI